MDRRKCVVCCREFDFELVGVAIVGVCDEHLCDADCAQQYYLDRIAELKSAAQEA